MHEFNAGSILLHKRLLGVPGLHTTLITNGWPADNSVFKNADAIFLYMDGGAGHPAVQPQNLELLRGLMQKGVGLGCAHYAVEVPKDKGGPEFQLWIGGHYEHEFSCNPMWVPDFQTFPDHAITRGVKPYALKDEWYINMRFRPNLEGVVPILVAKPSDAVRNGPYVWPAGPYKHIQEASGRDETMMWAVERADGGRGFGFTGGHFHKNWANDNFRKTVLNAMLWSAKVAVPASGLDSAAVTDEELLLNLDPKNGPKPTLESLRAEHSGPCACQIMAQVKP
jgi:type 1 glutamine amidotransferase